jgi:asparagine synthase (glutamine-hydrolysing)
MVPRGPDGAGVSHGPGVALGHRRLAVIDLSEAGRQPMANEDGTVEIVFNGEIYNFLELRPQLEAAGHRFHSRTDSEVLIHGYEEWGLEGLLRRIRGMYAFALYDARRGEIHLARDPLGKKPLFFRAADGELAFASSARALAMGLNSTPEIDLTAVHDLMWHLYIPGPRTIFQGVEKLPPGHALSMGQDGRRRDLVHWRPDFHHPEQGVDEEEWLERVEAALATAVRRRLVADVPVGVMLSGGVDSSLVTALAAKAVGRVQTYAVATEDPAMDESRFALAVAKRYDTAHHELAVQGDIRADLPALAAAMGEPLGDSSAVNLYAISRLARQSVTVALTGDGGDEAFGGYSHFWAYHHAGRLKRFLPRPLGRPLALAGEALGRGPGMIRRAGTLFWLTGAPLEATWAQAGRMLDASTRASLFTPAFRASVADHDPTAHYVAAIRNGNGALPTNLVMQAHMQTMLPDDYLAKVDLATMGASLEARSPFLDLDVVELAMRIPAAVRFSGNEPKGLLRKLARRHLPNEVIDRQKQGFRAPIARWLRQPEWAELMDDLVLGPHVEQRGWFQRKTLQRLVEEHRQGGNRAHLLWTLTVLELWLRASTATAN